MKQNDTIKKVIEIEAKHTSPNSVTISNTVYEDLVSMLEDRFKAVKTDTGVDYYNYKLKWN